MQQTFSDRALPMKRLLIYLRLAIEEARTTRSLVESRLVMNACEADERTSSRLAELDREIAELELQVVELSSRLERADGS